MQATESFDNVSATDGPVLVDGHAIASDDSLRPRKIELTGLEMLDICVIAIGIPKVILSYMNQSVWATTLDLVGGLICALLLRLLKLCEPICPKKWDWFFHLDLVPSICYCFWRFIGGVISVLLALGGTLTITSLSSIPIFIVAHFVPRVHLNIWLLIYICFMGCVHTVRMPVNALSRRVRKKRPAKLYAVGLRDAYGLRKTVLEQYEWSGTVGTTLGFFCGMGLVWSPLCVVYFLSHKSKTP